MFIQYPHFQKILIVIKIAQTAVTTFASVLTCTLSMFLPSIGELANRVEYRNLPLEDDRPDT